jgi:hypothetical protein
MPLYDGGKIFGSSRRTISAEGLFSAELEILVGESVDPRRENLVKQEG